MSLDLTWPVTVFVFFAGLFGVLLVVLPRVRAIHELRELVKEQRGRVSNVAEDLSLFKQKEFKKLADKVEDTAQSLNKMQLNKLGQGR